MSSSSTTKSRRNQVRNTGKNPKEMIAQKQQAFEGAGEDLGVFISGQLETLKKQMGLLREKKKQVQAKQKMAKEKRILAAKRCAQNETRSALNQLEKAKKAYHDSQEALESLDDELKEKKVMLRHVQDEQARVKALRKTLKQFDKQWVSTQKSSKAKSA